MSELAYAERFERGLTWRWRLEAEHDNLRAALDYLEERDPIRNLQLAGALGWFWGTRSDFAEASRRLENALASTAENGPLTARALTVLGFMDTGTVRSATALSRIEQGIALWRTVGNETELIEASLQRGWALYSEGEKSRAFEAFQETLDQARSLGDQALINQSIAGVCQLLVATGDFERAEPLALELHSATRGTEDVSLIGSADHYLADFATVRGDYSLAEQHRRSGLESAVTAGDVLQQTTEMLGLAITAAGLGRDEDALRLDGAVEAKRKELGISHASPLLQGWSERDVGAARTRLGDSRAQTAFDEGRAMAWEQAIELALGKTVSVGAVD